MEEKSIQVHYATHKNVTVATITGSKLLDATNSKVFGDQVLGYLSTRENIQLLINFEHVSYMSSAGLTELLRINEALQAWSATVRLWGLNCDIHNVFTITHLDKLFVIMQTDSLETAIESCAKFKGH